MQVKALPGFRDFYPDEIALKNRIFAAWREVARRYGFEEYDGPPLEALELYTQKSGAEIVEQLYSFTDKGGRDVALRPEMTPSLARMVTARATALKKPIRWYSMPQLFRYERQQRGRLKEHFQLNMDIIGEPGPLADAEIIAATIDIMRELGLGSDDIRVRVSDRRVMQALVTAVGVDESSLGLVYGAIDKLERVDHAQLTETLTAKGIEAAVARRALECGQLRGMSDVRSAVRAVCGEDTIIEDFATCVGSLESMGLGPYVDVDLSIVRGLDYYTGVVFELFDAGRSLRAICGGGRYDQLLASLGGVDLPAVGFGMGDVVLGELLRDHGWSAEVESRLDAFLVAVTQQDLEEVLRLVHLLRDAGLRVEYSLKAQSITKQLRIAAARPARFAAIVGPDEREAKEVVLRNLQTGGDARVGVDSLIHELSNGLGGGTARTVASTSGA